MDVDWSKINTSAVPFSHMSSGVIVSGLFHIKIGRVNEVHHVDNIDNGEMRALF